MKFLQRSLAILLAFSMCAGMMFTTAFADEHVHDWKLVEGKDVTCTEDGFSVLKCSACGEEDRTEFRAEGHNKGELVHSKAATCTEQGANVYKCWKCPEEILELVPALGHTLEPFPGGGMSPTCEDDGVDAFYCTVCGEAVKETVKAEGHKGVEWMVTKEATCTEDGEMAGTCLKCAQTVTQAIPAAGHDFADGKCSVCDAAEPKAECPEDQHDWELDFSKCTDPTCTEAGIDAWCCTICDATKEEENFPAAGHKFVDGTCPVCGASESAPECKHSNPTHYELVPATCDKAGVKAHWVCNDCGKMFAGTNETEVTEADLAIPVADHDFRKSTEIWDDDEVHETTCGICGKSETAGHSYGEGAVTTEPTATEAGEMTYTCQDCGHKKIEAVPATGSEGPGQDSDHNGHLVREAVTQAPTCTEPGRKQIVCFTCGGKYFDEAIPATGHTFDKHVELTSNDEAHQSVCSACGASEERGHDYDNGRVTQEATATEAGEATYTCQDCGHKKTESIPATGIVANPNPVVPGDEIDDTYIPLGGEPDDGGAELDDERVPLAGLVTRAQFVDYLYRYEGSPSTEKSTFVDVPEDHEYADAVGWGQAVGIAFGIGENRFAPDELVTVGQARLFLTRYAQYSGIWMPELASLVGLDDDILFNADEVMDEFFGNDPPENGMDAA